MEKRIVNYEKSETPFLLHARLTARQARGRPYNSPNIFTCLPAGRNQGLPLEVAKRCFRFLHLYSMIGVFDSGFGGLTIFRELVKQLPKYDYIYLGDSARAPYGNRSQDLIFEFSKQAVDYLFKEGCQLIILACNTASSEALRRIQQEYLPKNYPERRVLGVIRPTVEEATILTKNNRIGVIGTEGTVSSRAYVREIKNLNPKIIVFQQACPLLVPIIEAGEHNWEGTDLILKKYLKPFLNKKIDTLILGCTHYPIIKNKIKKLAKNIKLISQEKIIGPKLADYLNRHPEIEKRLSKTNKKIFLTTDLTERFEKLGSKFFGKKFPPKIIQLD